MNLTDAQSPSCFLEANSLKEGERKKVADLFREVSA